MMTFWLKWVAFFRPLGGWKTRYRQAKMGRNTWEVPGKPFSPKVIPFPVEWLPHRLDLVDGDNSSAHSRGFVFLPGVCVDTGKEVEVGTAVSCCRCGVTLSPEAAHMFSGFDPPYCKRCKWVIKLL